MARRAARRVVPLLRDFRMVVGAAFLVLLLGACGDDGPEPTVAAVTISMADFTIDVPDVVPSGLVEVRGLNEGELTHQAVFARLSEGQTAAEYVEAYLGDVAGTLEESDLRGGVQLVRPAEEQTVTVDLEPGHYVVLCSLPGPEAGENHLSNGMWEEFTVEGTTSDAPNRVDLVKSDGRIELIDWAFDLPDTLAAGGVYTVVNSGTQVHEIGMAELADGATSDDVVAFLTGQAEADAPPPIDDLSGVGFLSPGESQTLPIDVASGSYVFVCYIPDPNDGIPHFLKGMISVVDVE
ncbi:hypothetical protein [Ilumatobacter coccineus]|uniref:Blue (type 1) copper domain-containing protein n=1 Tax=Ilumatobacter coccineus (strain NBRC 103263 / KCTC 29153 / YM16-304) TaxID=1313172 RepID=A0A6C7E6N5_ILUCY|nr:hypothetical protein [Ilumatobacter coccineus]BAN00845.1 hypothetical protein YM304_05310 [Ilumatobacter coccineus YM16-304]